jgi:Polyketide cyclase / dehydrase and lipid transport
MARSYYSTIFEQSADAPVRNVLYQGNRIRQKLLAMSDVERSQTYEFAEARTIPGQNYRATLRLTPVVDGDRTFVEWWATFDCKPERRDERVALFRESFARWLGSLRRKLDAQSAVC